jgi:hypothetical protein
MASASIEYDAEWDGKEISLSVLRCIFNLTSQDDNSKALTESAFIAFAKADKVHIELKVETVE